MSHRIELGRSVGVQPVPVEPAMRRRVIAEGRHGYSFHRGAGDLQLRE
jgi:hypothetical protein